MIAPDLKIGRESTIARAALRCAPQRSLPAQPRVHRARRPTRSAGFFERGLQTAILLQSSRVVGRALHAAPRASISVATSGNDLLRLSAPNDERAAAFAQLGASAPDSRTEEGSSRGESRSRRSSARSITSSGRTLPRAAAELSPHDRRDEGLL